MPRYEYKYVTIGLKSTWRGKKPERDYHEVIDEHARQGYRLVTIFAPGTEGYGTPRSYELIFEYASET